MIKNVIILQREDLHRDERSTPIEQIDFTRVLLEHRHDVLASELILFVDPDPGQIRVVKTRRLGGLNHPRFFAVPPGTILPSDLFDVLVCEKLDLLSPRVQLPKEKP